MRNKVILEYLIKWKSFPLDDAIWEGEEMLKHPNRKSIVVSLAYPSGKGHKATLSLVACTGINAWIRVSVIEIYLEHVHECTKDH